MQSLSYAQSFDAVVIGVEVQSWMGRGLSEKHVTSITGWTQDTSLRSTAPCGSASLVAARKRRSSKRSSGRRWRRKQLLACAKLNPGDLIICAPIRLNPLVVSIIQCDTVFPWSFIASYFEMLATWCTQQCTRYMVNHFWYMNDIIMVLHRYSGDISLRCSHYHNYSSIPKVCHSLGIPNCKPHPRILWCDISVKTQLCSCDPPSYAFGTKGGRGENPRMDWNLKKWFGGEQSQRFFWRHHIKINMDMDHQNVDTNNTEHGTAFSNHVFCFFEVQITLVDGFCV